MLKTTDVLSEVEIVLLFPVTTDVLSGVIMLLFSANVLPTDVLPYCLLKTTDVLLENLY